MRKGRFTEEQMVAIIREADCEPVSAVSKRHGISEQTTIDVDGRIRSPSHSEVAPCVRRSAEIRAPGPEGTYSPVHRVSDTPTVALPQRISYVAIHARSAKAKPVHAMLAR
jgi:hypothetical protein